MLCENGGTGDVTGCPSGIYSKGYSACHHLYSFCYATSQITFRSNHSRPSATAPAGSAWAMVPEPGPLRAAPLHSHHGAPAQAASPPQSRPSGSPPQTWAPQTSALRSAPGQRKVTCRHVNVVFQCEPKPLAGSSCPLMP